MEKPKGAGVIDLFNPPYEVWEHRKPTYKEKIALAYSHGVWQGDSDKALVICVANYLQAVKYLIECPSRRELFDFISCALDEDEFYSALCSIMPKETPPALFNYQNSYSTHDAVSVDREISEVGAYAPVGQYFIHGGAWANDESFKSVRPFSTTFCPQIAFLNAEWKGKAYDVGRVDFVIVKVSSPFTKCFLFDRFGEKGHECEVVFKSGLTYKTVGKECLGHVLVRKRTSKGEDLSKSVPVYAVEVEMY
jgi:hypothetical protein